MNYDITFCEGENCPLKERCVRFDLPKDTDFEHLRISFFMEIPFNKETKCCEYFWSK